MRLLLPLTLLASLAAAPAGRTAVSRPAAPKPSPPDLSVRLDRPDDGERQATVAFGVPEAGFADDFADLSHWTGQGLAVADHAAAAAGDAAAFTPAVYINKTDTGGDWRTLAQAALTVDVTPAAPSSCPGVGFASTTGDRWVSVVLSPADDAIIIERHLADGSTVPIARHPKAGVAPTVHIEPGRTYRLRVAWSPYSDALIAFLSDAAGRPLTSVRTVVDLPAARRPMLRNTGGPSRFARVRFDPHLDDWVPRWQWLKRPILPGDLCNPAVWKGSTSTYYMVWRQFGGETFHGIASSPDAVHWTTIDNHQMKCRGDMNVLVDPFGDGRVWITPGGGKLPWWSSDGADHFTHWTPTGKTVGDIHHNSRIQEVIDTAKHSGMAPVRWAGVDYRFVAFTENWEADPKPHTVVMLSNTLTEWTVAGDGRAILPPRDDFWGEKGSAIGSAFVLPDGNILLASCSCTNAGYTGAPEPSNVSVVVDGREPWRLLKVATLPDAPVSREDVWYQGPNFGTAFLYEPADDTLYYYGGFHDHSIGVMRAPHFARDRRP
jgi:hypothetical protein